MIGRLQNALVAGSILRSIGRICAAQEKRIVVVLLVLGMLLRLAAAGHYSKYELQSVENRAVAEALAAHKGYADAFRPGSGPTAHTGPFAPLLMAGVFKIFDSRSFEALAALTFLTTVAIILSFFFFFRCFYYLAVPVEIRIAALAFLCLVPFQINLETTDLVVWEAAYAAVTLAVILFWIFKLDSRPSISITALAMLGFAVDFLELLSPAAGLGAAGALGLLVVRRTRWPIWLLIGTLMLVTFVAITTPWQLRNERLLHAPIRTRSSFGLSIAVGFYDGQVSELSQREANMNRVTEIHPHHVGGKGYERMLAAGGEVAYNRKLLDETMRWIRSHPAKAAFIAFRNLWNFYCPPAWFWDRWQTEPPRLSSYARSILVSMLSVIGLGALAWFVWRKAWPYYYLLPVLILPAAPYVMTFSLLRYRYPVSSLLIFLAFTGIGKLLSRLRVDHRIGAAPFKVASHTPPQLLGLPDI